MASWELDTSRRRCAARATLNGFEIVPCVHDEDHGELHRGWTALGQYLVWDDPANGIRELRVSLRRQAEVAP